jgi:hypothetical protein
MLLLGLTDEQTALDCNISVATVTRLRQGKFCKAVKRAELAREKIYRQKVWDGKNGWQGTAWFLERKYATQFAKPEILLAVNQQVSTGPQNVVVIGPERAAILANRHEQIRAKTRELLDNRDTSVPVPVREISAGNGQSAPASSRPEPPGRAPSSPDMPAAWWEQFVLAGKAIPKADATEALRLVLAELRMSVDVRALEFPTDNVVQTSFCRALGKVTGSDLGWRTLVGMYETQRIRERLRTDH